MITEVKLPRLGKTMEEATIVHFSVATGDRVKKGDCIFEVETDKAAVEVESPADGFVRYILAEPGQTLPVGQPILILAGRDEKIPQDFIDSLKVTFLCSCAKEDVPQSAPAAEIPVGRAVKTSMPPEQITLGATIPLTEKQKITAQKMLRSKREIPCFYLTVKADVTGLVELRSRLNETADVKISYNDFIMRAVAIGLEKFPIMTGRLANGAVHLAESIGIGLAIFVPDGLVAPIVKDVQKKDVVRIARDSKTLIEKARNNKLAPADLEGGCITISNLGSFGVESFIPIVVPGQCSILGIGCITDVPVPDNDRFVVRKLMSMTLSVDHKITNGAYATQFLDFVRKLLEDTSNFS